MILNNPESKPLLSVFCTANNLTLILLDNGISVQSTKVHEQSKEGFLS